MNEERREKIKEFTVKRKGVKKNDRRTGQSMDKEKEEKIKM